LELTAVRAKLQNEGCDHSAAGFQFIETLDDKTDCGIEVHLREIDGRAIKEQFPVFNAKYSNHPLFAPDRGIERRSHIGGDLQE
jgi:hypothetical protein